jgi:hypothetical protein
MFQCLVIHTSLDDIYYIHAPARYILLRLLSGLVTCVKSRFLEYPNARPIIGA